MEFRSLATTIIMLLVSLTLSESVAAQDYEGTGVFGGGGNTNPLGNISLSSGTTVGPAVGTYTTSVANSDGTYTVHHISVDAASNVVTHNKERFDGEGGSSTEEVPGSKGEKMGDVIGGGLEGNFFSDPSTCLSFNCDGEGPGGGSFSDPYSWSFTSLAAGG